MLVSVSTVANPWRYG